MDIDYMCETLRRLEASGFFENLDDRIRQGKIAAQTLGDEKSMSNPQPSQAILP